MRFEFATSTRIVFGPGSLREIGSLAKDLGRRALVVTGSDVSRAAELVALLERADIESRLFPVRGEPEIETVEQGITVARKENCDFVISFGGGSALDAGKAIAVLLTNRGELLDYLEVIGHGKSLSNSAAPFVAIPTTAGTGSEVTRNAVLASTEHRVKVSLRSAFLLARIALVDPELTQGLPPSITASTGLDALTQLIEPFVSPRCNPMTDSVCVDGMGRVARSLRRAFHNGQDTAAREDMALASLFGGLALANAGLGAVHGFAAPIGGMFPAPHGAVCAALLPHVMEANLAALRQRQPENEAIGRYDQVARVLCVDQGATAKDGVEWVRRLVADLQIPGLGSYDITREHSAELVDKASKASSMKANPIVLTADELKGVLEHAL